MFQPNTTGLLSHRSGLNAFGEITYGRGRRVRCAIVNLEGQLQKSPIRADSSASRGAADEVQSIGKVLFPAAVKPSLGDIFEMQGMKVRLNMIAPRYAVTGVLDHWECEFEAMP